MAATRFYATWSKILTRCLKKNNPDYKYYGGRGIKVCDKWREFKNFQQIAGL